MKTEKYCMPDNVNSEEEFTQYLCDIGAIKWEFVEWIEKETGECIIKGWWENYNFDGIGIKNCGEIVKIISVKKV